VDKLRFEYWLIKGQAEAGLGDYGSAIQSLLEGNKSYNSDTRLLNTLGECYLKTGDKAKALDVLKASLRLNPDQKDIQALVEKTEK
jgi:tetratricopeptide (TPR) repeat protein